MKVTVQQYHLFVSNDEINTSREPAYAISYLFTNGNLILKTTFDCVLYQESIL